MKKRIFFVYFLLLVSIRVFAGSDAHQSVKGVDPEKALGWLKNGNARFVKNQFRKDGRSSKERKGTVAAQHPHTILLSCADSRVPPEHIFDQGIGEIFVVRVAGQALDTSVIASIEYAAEHLGSKLVVVMGHDSCGAVKAALTTPEGKTAGSPSLDKLVADLQPRLKSDKGRMPASESFSKNLAAEVELNAKGVAKDLMARSEIISKKVKAGELKIVSAVYALDSGKVSFHDQH
jgi:carbonic anhydrase